MSTIEFKHIDDVLHNELYSEYIRIEQESFNNPLTIELESIYNNIISKYSITKDQEFVLINIFNIFKYVQEIIDPKRVEFSIGFSEDDDVLLYRKNDNELINLIIHPEDDFTLSIISKTSGNSIEYFDNKDVDFEKIVYNFLR